MTTGNFFVISAPSGTGKTSLVRAMIDQDDDIGVAVSHTTRQQRSDEIEGINYHFITEGSFRDMVESHKFLEWATVFGHLYGTSIAAANRVLARGQHLILEIDWQGANQIRRKVENVKTIFLFPPSHKALHDRLVRRAQDDKETVKKRLSNALEELSHYEEYDYLVVNDDFSVALKELRQIVNGSGHLLHRNAQLPKLRSLLSDLGLGLKED